MNHIHEYKDLEKYCTVPFGLYKVPSNKIYEIFPTLYSSVYHDNYDRWADCLDYCYQQYGNNFTIDQALFRSHKKYHSSLAEIYHIAHIDKCINGYVNIRYDNNSYKVQPGIKRLLLLECMPVHNVPCIVFGKTPHTKKLRKDTKIKRPQRLVYAELGFELQDWHWDQELKSRLSKENIQVNITSYSCTMNGITFFERDAYKKPWRLVYK